MFAPAAVVSANARYAAMSSAVRLRWQGNAESEGACAAVRGDQQAWSALSPPIRMTGPGRGPADACGRREYNAKGRVQSQLPPSETAREMRLTG